MRRIVSIAIGILTGIYAYGGTSIQNPLLDTPLRGAGAQSYVCSSGNLTVDGNGNYVCVDCPGTGTYNPSTRKCETSAIPSCSSGYTYNSSTGKCESPPNSARCPAGGSWNNSTKRCEAPLNITYVKRGFSFEDSGGIIWYGMVPYGWNRKYTGFKITRKGTIDFFAQETVYSVYKDVQRDRGGRYIEFDRGDSNYSNVVSKFINRFSRFLDCRPIVLSIIIGRRNRIQGYKCYIDNSQPKGCVTLSNGKTSCFSSRIRYSYWRATYNATITESGLDKSIPIINGNSSYYIGYPRYSDGDFNVTLYIRNGNFRLYLREDDNCDGWSGTLNYRGAGTTRTTRCGNDAGFEFDGKGHFRFTDRKRFNSGWRPFYCPLGADWSDRYNACIRWSCPSAYRNQGGICVADPICDSGYSYNSFLKKCEKCVERNWKEICTKWDRYDPANGCIPPATKNGNVCQLDPIYICPSGYSWNGVVCEASPSVSPAQLQ